MRRCCRQARDVFLLADRDAAVSGRLDRNHVIEATTAPHAVSTWVAGSGTTLSTSVFPLCDTDAVPAKKPVTLNFDGEKPEMPPVVTRNGNEYEVVEEYPVGVPAIGPLYPNVWTVIAPEPNEERSIAPAVFHDVQPVPPPVAMLLTPNFHSVFGSGVAENDPVDTSGSVELLRML